MTRHRVPRTRGLYLPTRRGPTGKLAPIPQRSGTRSGTDWTSRRVFMFSARGDPRGTAPPGRRRSRGWGGPLQAPRADDRVVEFGPGGGRVTVEEKVQVRGRTSRCRRDRPRASWWPSVTSVQNTPARRPPTAGRSRNAHRRLLVIWNSSPGPPPLDTKARVQSPASAMYGSIRFAPTGPVPPPLHPGRTWQCRSRGCVMSEQAAEEAR